MYKGAQVMERIEGVRKKRGRTGWESYLIILMIPLSILTVVIVILYGIEKYSIKCKDFIKD